MQSLVSMDKSEPATSVMTSVYLGDVNDKVKLIYNSQSVMLTVETPALAKY